MSPILIFLIILAPSAAIAIYFDRKIEETIAVTCFIFIISVYLFGLAGVMLLGVYACIAIALLSGIYAIFKVIKNRTLLFKNILLPGLLVLFCCFALVWWAHKGRMFSSWDEFSHWGLVVKNMYILNSFGDNPAATTMFRSYPPATALFQYLWCKLSGSFNDFHVIRSMNILCLALLLPIFKCIDWKNKRFIIPIGLIMLALPIMFYSEFYTTIYVDGILGLLFAYILFSYFTSKKLDAFCIINISLALFVLTLIKDSGTGLAIIALIIIAIDLFIFKRDTSLFRIKKSNLSRLIVIGITLISVLIAYYSWKIHLEISGINGSLTGVNCITLSGLIDILKLDAPMYKYEVINNFFVGIFSKEFDSYMFNMNYLLWIILTVVVGGVLIHLVKDKLFRRRIKFAIFGILGGCIAYTLSLLLLYLFAYSEYEAVNLASYPRYLSTYLLGMITFLVFMIIYNLFKERDLSGRGKKYAMLSLLIGVSLFTNMTPLLNITILAPKSMLSANKIRAPYENINRFSDLFDSEKDRVFVISQNTTGFDYWIIYYNLTPVKVNQEKPWSIGTPYSENDIWTQKCNCDEWLKILEEKYTYVYLYRIDDQFIKEFSGAFKDASSIKRDALYKVVKTGEEVYLEYIDD